MKKVYLTLMVAATMLVACGPSAQEEADKNDKIEAGSQEDDKAIDEMMNDTEEEATKADSNAVEAQNIADEMESAPASDNTEIERDPKPAAEPAGEAKADVTETVAKDKVETKRK